MLAREELGKGFYVVGGPAKLYVDGEGEVFGAEVNRDVLTIPSRRQAPLIVRSGVVYIEEARYVVDSPSEEYLIPSDWVRIASEIGEGDRILILGGVDTGKSGLTLYLANRLIARGLKVGIIDTDIGQSDVGPPGTIGYSSIDKQFYTYQDIPLNNAYFIGDITPAGHLLQLVTGVETLNRTGSDDVTIVNTCGYIHGGRARALKKGIAEVLDPTMIIFLDREGELTHLKHALSRYRQTTLEIPSAIKPKRMVERIDYRKLLIESYFENASIMSFRMENIYLDNTVLGEACYKVFRGTVYGLYWDGEYTYVPYTGDRKALENILDKVEGRKIFINLARLKGLLVGLYKGDRFLNIGMLESMDPIEGLINIYSKVDDRVDRVVFGYLIISPDGSRLARLRPGFLG